MYFFILQRIVRVVSCFRQKKPAAELIDFVLPQVCWFNANYFRFLFRGIANL